MNNDVKYIKSNPDANTFLLRCFKEIKDNIVEELTDFDKNNYYDCCKMLVEYEKYYENIKEND